MENWITVDELASMLKVGKDWIYQQTMKKGPGAIPKIKVGKHLRFDLAEVEKWIMKRQEVR